METLVFNNGGHATTDSLRVAEKFGKNHRRILEDIRRILTAQNRAVCSMFTESIYYNQKNVPQPYFTMNRDGFSLLVMGFTGSKALDFKIAFIEAFNKMESELTRIYTAGESLFKHTQRPTQIGNSKEVNQYNYFSGGPEQVIEYNRKNCQIHTGMLPREVKEHARTIGVPSKHRTSAKEVLRHKRPDIAASMSVTDEFCKTGRVSVEEAATLCRDKAMPLFQKMQEYGLLAS